LEALVHSIDGIVWESTPDTFQFTFVSRQVERLLGYQPEEWLANPRFWQEKLHPEDAAQAIQTCRDMVARREPYNYEYRMIAADGRTVWIRESGVVLLENDKPAAVRGIFQDITEQKLAAAELDELNKQLLETSRQAGMAEVATGVLHNVGNVLNSVNVSTTLIREKLRGSEVASLVKLGGLLQQYEADLPGFLTAHPKGKLVPRFIIQLADQLGAENKLLQEEQDQLTRNVEHIKEIVSMQQNYARVSGIIEPISVANLLDDALQINAAGFSRHGVQVVRQYSDVPPATADKHKVLQILINLVHNAKYALDDSGRLDKRLTVGIGMNGNNCLKVTVNDNGIGIPPENLNRIFSHGFSTRKGGHGFGLHSGANAAKEMGGQLSVHSEGAGKGATFTLELPLGRQTTEQKIETTIRRRTDP
jgi:PAS domain S-box-containing protein